jgi:hypothetical protein
MDYYILKDRTPIKCTYAEFVKWGIENGQGWPSIHVADEKVGDVRVSTVFLGMDHNWGEGPPLLFETMTFRDGESEDCWRCSTYEEAEKQHRSVVASLRFKVVNGGKS